MKVKEENGIVTVYNDDGTLQVHLSMSSTHVYFDVSAPRIGTDLKVDKVKKYHHSASLNVHLTDRDGF